jgi:ribosomal protein S18 acetylase RimI-like enzyme
MPNDKDLIIREFREEDVYQVAKILLSSFQSKFYAIKSFSLEKQIQFFIDASFVDDHSFDGYIVADYKDEVVGVMLLKWKGQNRGVPTNKKSLLGLIKNYGLFHVLKMFLLFSLLSEKVANGECYIEHIAVKEGSRGLGIGTRLLEYSITYTTGKLILPSTTLYVASSNIQAKQLYERIGFTIKNEKRSLFTKILLHERNWIYMKVDHFEVHNKRRFVMKSGWWLGFIGFLGFRDLKNLFAFLRGEVPFIALLGLLWFFMFSMFIPERRK